MKLHISIKAEPIFHLLGLPITNSLLLSFVVLLVFAGIALNYKANAQKSKKNKLFYFITFALNLIYELFGSILGTNINKFFALLGSFFLFILLQNWFGLLPGVGSLLIKVHEEGHELMAPIFRAATADLNTTIALALISVVLIQYNGIKYLGVGGYGKRFFNVKSPIDFFTGILEIVSEFSKIISFSFRLFGNIFAGEVLILVIAFLVPWVASSPFLLLEIFVGLIQALVFAMLTAVFLNLAITKHH